ncbi:MAG: ATP-binding protein [Myxococcales bacterium]|nr:ATP-binding protein [Myxococcales bacterium]
MNTQRRLRPRVRDTILQSLRAGVVPRMGQEHIQVGRAAEVEALVGDIGRIADGGSSVRFVVGAYGSGKTFFLNLIRSIAHEKRLITLSADLAPDRRLHASGGQARSLYQELTRNLATRSRPEGGAMPALVERFVNEALKEAKATGASPRTILQARLERLSEGVGGYDFAEVIGAYWRAHDTGDDSLKASAVRWLRGEFSTKTEARAALGVRTIVDDASVYDHLKLLAHFSRLAGFAGLLVTLDEVVNLYKLGSGRARRSNYEQILRILNDCLQGSVEGIGFVFGATPDLLYDTRRGLYSYEALQSRLAPNRFASELLVDLSSPVIPLENLTPEDLFVLIRKLAAIHAQGQEERPPLGDAALEAFLEHCAKRVGEAYFRTPRNTIKAFIDLLEVLRQNPGARWEELLGRLELAPEPEDLAIADLERDGEAPEGSLQKETAEDDDELSSFRL